MKVQVSDQTFGGDILNEIELTFATESVTVKEIITERVLQEVEKYNAKMPDYFNGLVVPTEAEKTINGYKLKAKKVIDGEQQVYTALDAFMKNGYFILIDNTQAETLDQHVTITSNTNISFVKLTPLVGG